VRKRRDRGEGLGGGNNGKPEKKERKVGGKNNRFREETTRPRKKGNSFIMWGREKKNLRRGKGNEDPEKREVGGLGGGKVDEKGKII